MLQRRQNRLPRVSDSEVFQQRCDIPSPGLHERCAEIPAKRCQPELPSYGMPSCNLRKTVRWSTHDDPRWTYPTDHHHHHHFRENYLRDVVFMQHMLSFPAHVSATVQHQMLIFPLDIWLCQVSLRVSPIRPMRFIEELPFIDCQ